MKIFQKDILLGTNTVLVMASSPDNSCPFCLDIVTKPLELECGHRYCEGCLVGWFTSQINQKITKLSCEICRLPVERWVLESILPPNMFEKFNLFDLEHILEKEFNLFYCPNKDCLNIMSASEGTKYVECPECKKEYCMTCKVEWHKNITCIKYQEWASENKDADSLTLTFLRKEGAKQCPKCNVWVEKNGGCDHMTCRKCQYEFWWSTLEPYPNGRSTWSQETDPLPEDPFELLRNNFALNRNVTFSQASQIASAFRIQHRDQDDETQESEQVLRIFEVPQNTREEVKENNVVNMLLENFLRASYENQQLFIRRLRRTRNYQTLFNRRRKE